MSTAKILKDVASLCAASAKQCVEAIFELGGEPTDPVEKQNWTLQRSRLRNQMRSLDALNIELGAASIAAALKDYEDDLASISAASKDAKKDIRKIKDAAKLLTKVARVIELGSAILAAAAKPGADTIVAVVKAAQAVLDPKDADKDAKAANAANA